MGITHHVRDDGVLVTVATGRVTEADLLEHFDAHIYDPSIGSGILELVDFTGLESAPVTVEAIRRLVEHEREHRESFEGNRVAVVAPADLPFGLNRMYEMMSGDRVIVFRVFRDLDEAESWLKAPPEEVSDPEDEPAS